MLQLPLFRSKKIKWIALAIGACIVIAAGFQPLEDEVRVYN